MTEIVLAKAIAAALEQQAQASSWEPLYVDVDDLSSAVVDGYVDLVSLARSIRVVENTVWR